MTPGLLSPTHIAIALMIVLVIFGAKRLPEIGRGLGRGMREFIEAVTRSGNTAGDPEPPSLPTYQAEAPQGAHPPSHQALRRGNRSDRAD